MQNNEILQSINAIIETLQKGKWGDHSPALLIASQGKLATYMSNLGEIVANAEYEYRLKELNHEQYEIDQYFIHRQSDMSQLDAKMNAKIDAFAKERSVYRSKKTWQELRSILKACESLSVACSTTLKHQKVDRDNSNFQGN